MHIRPHTIVDEDYVPVAAACGSAEPMQRADHKAKKHPRPSMKPRSRRCGGRFALRRRRVWADLETVRGADLGGE